MQREEVTGVVLAGGRSSRMGRDKSWIPYQGIPLVMHAVNTLRKVAGTVVISANDGDYRFTGCPVWPDELPVCAPMAGIWSSMKRSETPWNIFLSCDMPLVDARLFTKLFACVEGNQLVWPVHAGGIEPLCGLYHRSILPVMEELIAAQEFSLRKMALRIPHMLVPVGPEDDYYSEKLFLNLNTPDDLQLLPEK